MQDLDLEPASDTMSVEDQIAANTATLKDALTLFEDELAEKVAAENTAAGTKMAKAVLDAIGENTPVTPAAFMSNSPATVKASSTGVVTATQLGYTMSETYPDEITGWRGVTLEKDGDTTVVYSNIADSVATEIGDIYGFGTDRAPGEPAHYDVVERVAEGRHDIPWAVVKRADDKSITTQGEDEDDLSTTTFAGNVRGLAGTFSCTAAMCVVPTGDDIDKSDATGGRSYPTILRAQ